MAVLARRTTVSHFREPVVPWLVQGVKIETLGLDKSSVRHVAHDVAVYFTLSVPRNF